MEHKSEYVDHTRVFFNDCTYVRLPLVDYAPVVTSLKKAVSFRDDEIYECTGVDGEPLAFRISNVLMVAVITLRGEMLDIENQLIVDRERKKLAGWDEP